VILKTKSKSLQNRKTRTPVNGMLTKSTGARAYGSLNTWNNTYKKKHEGLIAPSYSGSSFTIENNPAARALNFNNCFGKVRYVEDNAG
jgi:hypothetical protein